MKKSDVQQYPKKSASECEHRSSKLGLAGVIFVTGTDTGVGKTVLTALLLRHLRRRGVRALAMKPFCSGDRGDVRVLQGLQAGELSDGEMNPWFYRRPVAPLAAQRARGEKVILRAAVAAINSIKKRCNVLLIEGAGGLLSPLGEGFAALDLIRKIRCGVVVAAPDRLGCVNQVLLTVSALRGAGVRRFGVVLMGREKPDASCATNRAILGEKLGRGRVFYVPFLGKKVLNINELEKKEKKLKKTLALLAGLAKTARRSFREEKG